MSFVFVDSSVWIDYFRGAETPRPSTALDSLARPQEAVVGDLVLMEVLQGYRNLRELQAPRRPSGS